MATVWGSILVKLLWGECTCSRQEILIEGINSLTGVGGLNRTLHFHMGNIILLVRRRMGHEKFGHLTKNLILLNLNRDDRILIYKIMYHINLNIVNKNISVTRQ